jgi:hypothetical protein
MSNTTNNILINFQDESKNMFVVYDPFIFVIVGTLFNFFTIIILCQTTFRNTNIRPSIHYTRTIAIFDILMLY